MNYIDKYCKFDREYNIHEYYHYVEDVLNHRIVTSKAIYLACKRFERWLSRTDIYFDEKDVDQRINLIYLMKHTKGKCAGQHYGYWNGKHLTPETIEKLKEVRKGRIPWNKGKRYTYTEEEKARIYASRRGRPSWNKGIPMTEEAKRKSSESHKKKTQKFK